MQINKKGFVWLPVLLGILVVLALSGGAYWYVHSTAQPTQGQLSQPATTTNQTTVAQEAGWRPASALPATYSSGWTWYWLANGVVSCMNHIVTGADPKTFQADPYGVYGKDIHNAYYCSDVISGADAKTFAPIGRVYAKDATHVYYSGMPIDGADPATFVFVTHPDKPIYPPEYAKDKYRVYDIGQEVLNADTDTFTTIDNQWYVDKNSGFVNGKRVRGVSAASFLKSIITSLPAQCQKGYFAQSNYPLPFRVASSFSIDGSVRAYVGADVCIVDSTTGIAEYYRLPGEAPVLSRDGSKIYYTKYYGKEWGMGESSQAELEAFYKTYNASDYGLHTLDRKSGVDTLLVHSILPSPPSAIIAVFWDGSAGDSGVVDVDLSHGLLIHMPVNTTTNKLTSLTVRTLPQAPWDFLTQADVEQLTSVRTLQLPAGEEFRRAAEISPDGKYVDYIHVKSGTVTPALHGRLNIATGENVLSTY